MFDRNQFILAYSNKEWATCAGLMIDLYAMYVEGYIDSAATTYNNLIGKIPKAVFVEMVKQSPFTSHKNIDLTAAGYHRGAPVDVITSAI